MTFNILKKFSSFIITGLILFVIAHIGLAFSIQTNSNDKDKDKDSCASLEEQEWSHGAEDCSTQSDPLIQVVQYNRNTWIFRQNKCVHYEAPFLYLFMGKNKALLIDAGATANETTFPLYDTVSNLLKSNNKNEKPLQLIVVHTHSHADHYAADGQFIGKPNVAAVVGLSVEEVKTFFNLNQWPEGRSNLDLGGRIVTIFPIPGHQNASVAFYDSTSKLLITGDTFYPGRLYVFDWIAFKQSIERLYNFATNHSISCIVGTHNEMSTTPGVDYPVGSTFQPEEVKLPLTVDELGLLNNALKNTTDTSERITFDKWIVVPR